MKQNFVLVCDEAEIIGKKPTFTGLFTKVNADSLPLQIAKFAIVFNFYPEDKKEYRLIIKIKSPNNKDILSSKEQKLQLSNDDDEKFEALGYILTVKNLVFEVEGLYMVQFYLDGKLFQELKFKVKKNNG